jgi:tetratricopeptide (TPR) repeat protein
VVLSATSSSRGGGVGEMDTAGLIELAKANHESGRIAEAEGLYREALARTPAAFQSGHVWYLLGAVCHAQGKHAAALESLRESIRLRPDFAHAHYHLGITLAEQGRHAEAEQGFRHALDLKPDFADCCARLGDALAAQGKIDQAEETYRQAAHLHPGAPLYLALASTLFRQNKVDEALASFRAAADLEPGSAEAQTSWGTALISMGKTEEAIAHLREAVRLKPDHAPAYGFLGELAKENCFSFSAAEIDDMRGLLADAQTSATDQAVLHFALAHVHDRLGDADAAFDHYRRANEMQHGINLKQGTAFDVSAHRRLVDDVIAGFTPEFFQRLAGAGNPSQTPVFIVGMPRSGTTLVDRIVSAHPHAASAGELIDLEKIVGDLPRLLDRPRTLELLSHLDRATAAAQAGRYLRRLEQLGPGALRVTDKMPQNYFYLGFIAALFPRARIIHCRRDPLDTCFSCYIHNFADFSTSLEGLGLYYREYERLMSHWRAVLPLSMHEVHYQALVAQPEPIIRELIAFCDLPWDDRCLTFHENRVPVHTVSRMQVRRPVYTSALGRWRKYAAHLEPLRRALQASL